MTFELLYSYARSAYNLLVIVIITKNFIFEITAFGQNSKNNSI